MGENLSYNPDARGGGVSWIALGATIVALEFRKETLSNAAARFRESNNLNKFITHASIGVMALHLLDAIPRQYDPIDTIVTQIGKIAGRE